MTLRVRNLSQRMQSQIPNTTTSNCATDDTREIPERTKTTEMTNSNPTIPKDRRIFAQVSVRP